MLLSVLISIIGIISVLILCFLVVNAITYSFQSQVLVLLVPIDLEIDMKLKMLVNLFQESNISPRIYALSDHADKDALAMAHLLEKEFDFFRVVDQKEFAEVLKNSDKSDILSTESIKDVL